VSLVKGLHASVAILRDDGAAPGEALRLPAPRAPRCRVRPPTQSGGPLPPDEIAVARWARPSAGDPAGVRRAVSTERTSGRCSLRSRCW